MIVLFAACDTAEPTLTPTITPTIEFDPRSMTAIPAGLPENPLQMVMQPVTKDLYVEPEVTQEPGVGEVLLPASSTKTELDLEAAILNYTSVTVDVVPVASPADALGALCDVSKHISAVWVDGVSFAAARAQNCGEPIFVVQKQVDGELQIGESGVIILTRRLGTTQVSILNNRTFCRLNVDDFYSWLLPLMVFRANNVNPANFEAIVEYDSAEDMVKAVADGECDGAGLSIVAYNQIVEGDEELSGLINVAFTSPPIPYAVLMYPVEIQLGFRVSLNEGLLELADDDNDSELLRAFLGQDKLKSVNLEDFAEFDAFLSTVKLDFSILGD